MTRGAERSRDASADGGGDVDTVDPTAPPELRLPKATRADWLVDVGGCSGVLIAPKFVLTSAGCARQSPEAGVVERSVQLRLTQENQSIKIPVTREHHQAAVRDRHQLTEFVILELAEDAPVRPVVLEGDVESRADEVDNFKHNQHARGVQLVGTQHTRCEDGDTDRKFAVDGRRDQHRCRDELMCVMASATCKALRSPSVRGSVFLVAQHARDGDDQNTRLVGVSLASSLSSCRDSRNPGSSVSQFLPIASLAEVIDLHSVGHRWTPSSGATTSWPHGSGSSGPSVDEDLGNPQQQQSALLDEFPQLGRLRVGNETVGHFGAYVVLIAPRFALTRALWLTESGILSNKSSNQSKQMQVVFQVGAFPVTNLIFQRELQGPGDVQYEDEDDDLVLLELEFDVGVSPIEILATSLPLDVVTPRIEITVLNATSESEEPNPMPIPGVITSVSLSSCPRTETKSSLALIVCAHAPHFAQNTPPTILNQGILRLDNALIGFSTTSTVMYPPSASDLYERYEFMRLVSERHIQFIAKATQSTAVLKRDDKQESVEESDPDADDFPSFIATFSSTGDNAELILCQGMLVAPKFVLTTASCALKNSISDIVFKLPHGNSIRVPYSPQMTIPHPKYSRSALSEAERFNIAILQLEVAVSVPPATLSLGGGSANQTSDELLGFRFNLQKGYVMGPPVFHFSRVAFNHSEKCSTWGSSDPTSGTDSQVSLCFTPSRGPPQRLVQDPTTSSPVVGDEDDTLPSTGGPEHDNLRPPSRPPASTSLDGSVIGKQLNNSRYSMVGFAVSQELSDGSENSDLDVYSISSVSAFAVFINAYVVGSSWEAGGLIVDGPLQISKRYIVGLRVSKTGQNFCGGSLIAHSYVLTAAHCVTDGLANWVSVGSSSSSGGATEAIPIIKESIVIHHKYGSPSQFSFDAAIFELKTPAYADPVKLDRSPDFANGEKATMYGYGVQAQPRSMSTTTSTSNSGNSKALSSEIHAVDLSLLSQAKCRATLPDIDKSMLCAVGDKGEDACKGDSGGPLVVPESRSDHDVLVGFVSSGYDCGLKNVPGIYMRVSSLAQFIEEYAVGAVWSAAIVPSPSLQTPTVSPSTPPQTPTVSPSTPSTDFELRDLNDVTPSKSPASDGSTISSDALTTPSTVSQPGKTAPIRGVDLPTDLNPQVRDALLLYLLGISSSSDFFISSDFLERLARENNEIRFFSSADLNNLLEIIKRHNRKPLYARRDRFKRRKTGADALRQEALASKHNGVSASTVCTP